MRTVRRVVLGLNFGHDRSACLIVDGVVRAAVAEERLSRIKHEVPLNDDGERYNVAPSRAIRYCLAAADVAPHEISLVVASTSYVLDVRTGRRRNLTPDDVYRQCPDLAGVRVDVVDHHVSHAASAIAGFGDAETTVLVVDGGGSIVGFDDAGHPAEFERTTVYDGSQGTLRMLARATGGPPAYGNSIGDVYQLFTGFLGFRRGEEGKTMALAAYDRCQPGWRPLPQFRTAITVGTDAVHQVAPEFQYTPDGGFHPALIEWFGPPRTEQDGSSAVDRAVAASVQWALEEALVELATLAHELGGARPRLCFAGGVALNCVANSRILRESPFEDMFVQPAATDDGTALGNALVGWWASGGKAGDYTFDSAYLGREYTQNEIDTALAANAGSIVIEAPDDLVRSLVADLIDGRIVALFRGRSEFGPRALGHRSILCDPRDTRMNDHLNCEVKHRETFRPFAPMVTEEQAHVHFDLQEPSPYMLLTADVRRQNQLPAITHVDGSARIQTVSSAAEPFLHRVLTGFAADSGVPVLLNTSFNDREPIVETPDDALRCFLNTGIDVLYIEGRRVTKSAG